MKRGTEIWSCCLWLLPVLAYESGKETALQHVRSRKCLCSRSHRWLRLSCSDQSWWPPCGWPLTLRMWQVQLQCHWGETLEKQDREKKIIRQLYPSMDDDKMEQRCKTHILVTSYLLKLRFVVDLQILEFCWHKLKCFNEQCLCIQKLLYRVKFRKNL